MISRLKCIVTAGSLCFCVSAFANTTAFNGYVQTSGNTGVDFNNLTGGNYKITVTSTGQLNYRYQVGDQVFDSNPEMSIRDLIGNRDTSWRDNGSRIGADPAPNLGETASPVWSGSLPANYQLMISDDIARPLSVPTTLVDTRQNQNQGGDTDTGFHSDPVVLGNTFGSNFDVSSLAPATVQLPANSLISVIADPGYYPWNGPTFFPFEEVPEPGTFALLLAGTLAGAAVIRRRSSRSLSR